jgi:hypothetical protein
VKATATFHLDQCLVHVAEVIVRSSNVEVRLIEVRVQYEGALTGRDCALPVEFALARDGRARQVGFGEIGIDVERSASLGLRACAPAIDIHRRGEPEVHVRTRHGAAGARKDVGRVIEPADCFGCRHSDVSDLRCLHRYVASSSVHGRRAGVHQSRQPHGERVQ